MELPSKIMNTIDALEKYLMENIGESWPEIRYFDGLEAFCDIYGNYKAKTLEESLKLFLKSKSV